MDCARCRQAILSIAAGTKAISAAVIRLTTKAQSGRGSWAPFITAYLKVNGRTKETRGQVAKWLAPFREHLYEAGIGQISEIFDGDPPHRPARLHCTSLERRGDFTGCRRVTIEKLIQDFTARYVEYSFISTSRRIPCIEARR